MCSWEHRNVTPAGTAFNRTHIHHSHVRTHLQSRTDLSTSLTTLGKYWRTSLWHEPQTFWVKFSGKTPLTEMSFFCSQWDSFTPKSQPSSCKANKAIRLFVLHLWHLRGYRPTRTLLEMTCHAWRGSDRSSLDWHISLLPEQWTSRALVTQEGYYLVMSVQYVGHLHVIILWFYSDLLTLPPLDMMSQPCVISYFWTKWQVWKRYLRKWHWSRLCSLYAS